MIDPMALKKKVDDLASLGRLLNSAAGQLHHAANELDQAKARVEAQERSVLNLQQAIFKGLNEIVDMIQEEVNMEIPENKFLVGVRGDHIVLGLPMRTAQMSKEDALSLAAYLVAVACTDPDKEFRPMLEALRQT